MAVPRILRWTAHNCCNYETSGLMTKAGSWGTSSIISEDNFGDIAPGKLALIDCWDSTKWSPETIGQTASLKLATILGRHTHAYQDIEHLIFDVGSNKALADHLQIQTVPACLLWCDDMILETLHSVHSDSVAVEAVIRLVKGSSQVQKNLAVFTSKASFSKLSLGQTCLTKERFSEARYEFKLFLKKCLSNDLDQQSLGQTEVCVAKAICGIAVASFRKNDTRMLRESLEALEAFPRAISFLSDVRRCYAALSMELLVADHPHLVPSHKLFRTADYTASSEEFSRLVESEESKLLQSLYDLYLSNVRNIPPEEEGAPFDKEAILKIL
eukprot:TRINITY_DN11065_c0_g1_i2.p1 TRINITY_DN11065_c0_g1~~TRINITY_DN11065_c0_g1_i2.p1  ORF type:complete len:328 (+),score=23.47 TRINITY_DN11065_c0_g1_i2:39-1022(+)